MKRIVCAAAFWAGYWALACAQVLRVQVQSAIGGEPLPGAAIELTDNQAAQRLRFATDSAGRVEVQNLSPGIYLCRVQAAGHEELQIPELRLVGGRDVDLLLSLKPSTLSLPDVVIRAGAERQSLFPLGEIPLTRERTQRFPATFWDPARLALAYAGIANADDQANGLIVRGNSPPHLRWRLEGVEIVNPNHLPNAGTLSDRPATASGGVLLFSAQLLDNATLLTGALPPGYGDALGGIMDIYWRNGNAQRREYTAQVGLLGMDLAAEGPLSHRAEHSYLFNLRYSTVGLLGQMGISFGNEQIDFWDYAFKTHFKGRKGHRWSLYGASGSSRNRFNPPSDSSAVRQFKDLFHIDFSSRTGLLGTTWQYTPWEKTALLVSAIGSAQRNARSATAPDVFSEQDSALEARLGVSMRLSHLSRPNRRLQAGLLMQYAFGEIKAARNDSILYAASVGTWTLQPWVNWAEILSNERMQLQAGLHALLWRIPNTYPWQVRLEPRLTFVHHLSRRHQFALHAGLNNQTHVLWFYALHPPREGESLDRLSGNPVAWAFQTSARYTWTLSEWWRLQAEAFYQRHCRMPASNEVHLGNISEIQRLGALTAEGQARHAGIEGTVERFLGGGWFALCNATLMTVQYRGMDGVWRQSRWNVGHIVNLTAGKEWTLESDPADARTRTFGVNGRLTWVGGQRTAPVDIAASAAAQATRYDLSKGYPLRLPDFLRLDLRIYWRRHLAQRRNSLLAFDLQNATFRQNIAYLYYDPLQQRILSKAQLSLVPNISWRLEW